MKKVGHCILADFKQRTRQQSYIVTLLAMSVLTLLFFPSPDAHYQTLVFNDYRGIYNSAWMGMCLAMLNVLFLPIICFYIVKNGLELDRCSKTCELIAATSVSKVTLIMAKWLTNVAILISIVLAMLISSALIQMFYGESYYLDLWKLLWPQLVFVFPLLLAIAAIAVMFESIPWLRGGFGNIVYFFMWAGSVGHTIESSSGVGVLLEQIDAEVTQRFPQSTGNTNVGVSISNEAIEVKSFVWAGIDPTMAHVWGMLPLLIACCCCLLIAIVCFDRFSHCPEPNKNSSAIANLSLTLKIANLLDRIFDALTKHLSFTRLLRLELKLLLTGRSTYWFLGILALNIAQLMSDQAFLVRMLLPISWLWCVLAISQLGQFEKQSNTQEIMAYSNQSPSKQGLASYAAAWMLLAIASLGGIVRFSLAFEWLLIGQLFIAISFTASLAYFCGSLTGTKRMFEGVYPALWYMGPFQTALYIDFFGINSEASWNAGVPVVYLSLSVLLLLGTLSLLNKKNLYRAKRI